MALQMLGPFYSSLLIKRDYKGINLWKHKKVLKIKY